MSKDTQLKPGHRRGGFKVDMVAREKFAQAVAAGKNNSDAYREAHPNTTAKPASINRMGTYFANDEWVQKRVVEIKAEAARIATEKTGIDKAYIVGRLRDVVERCMTAEPVMEKRDGKMEPTGEYVFNAAGANKALELLGKEIGMFVDRKEIRTGSLEKLTDAELTRLAQEFAAQCGLALGNAGTSAPTSGEQAPTVPTLQ